MPLTTLVVSSRSYMLGVTDDCAIATVVSDKGTLEMKEHESFLAALDALRSDLDLAGGDWKTITIVNVGEFK